MTSKRFEGSDFHIVDVNGKPFSIDDFNRIGDYDGTGATLVIRTTCEPVRVNLGTFKIKKPASYTILPDGLTQKRYQLERVDEEEK